MVYAGCVLVEASLNLHSKHELGDIHKEHPHPPSIFHQSSMQTKVALRSRMKELPFKSHEQLIPRFAPTAKVEQETNHSFHSPRMHPYLIGFSRVQSKKCEIDADEIMRFLTSTSHSPATDLS